VGRGGAADGCGIGGLKCAAPDVPAGAASVASWPRCCGLLRRRSAGCTSDGLGPPGRNRGRRLRRQTNTRRGEGLGGRSMRRAASYYPAALTLV
jgi:hypothetical protein